MWKNGRFVQWQEGTTPIMNASLHYGVAVFEGIRSYETDRGAAVFRLPEHIERFFYSAKVLGMEIPFSPENIKNGITDLLRITGLKDSYIRPIAWLGEESIGLHSINGKTDVAIAALPSYNKPKKTAYDLKISPYKRIDSESTHVEAKIAGHYVNTILALRDAEKSGFDDAILLDKKGFVAEASAANIFMFKNGFFVTPARGNILNGITRNTVFRMAGNEGYMIIERQIGVEELKNAEEVFICGTALEITPVSSIDGAPIRGGAPGKITKMIKTIYNEAVRGRKKEYEGWLTYVC